MCLRSFFRSSARGPVIRERRDPSGVIDRMSAMCESKCRVGGEFQHELAILGVHQMLTGAGRQESYLLGDILSRRSGQCNALICAVDIHSYSRRTSRTQRDCIDRFSKVIENCCKYLEEIYHSEVEQLGANIPGDLIFVPIGDGILIVFPFDEIPEIALRLATEFIRDTNTLCESLNCEILTRNGYCDCHSGFYLRAAVGYGRIIVYEDINRNYNVAGTAINDTFRVLDYADRMQILFTSEAYKLLHGFGEDKNFERKVIDFSDVYIKHGRRMSIFQLVDYPSVGLNTDPSPRIIANQSRDALVEYSSATPQLDVLEIRALYEILPQSHYRLTKTVRLRARTPGVSVYEHVFGWGTSPIAAHAQTRGFSIEVRGDPHLTKTEAVSHVSFPRPLKLNEEIKFSYVLETHDLDGSVHPFFASTVTSHVCEYELIEIRFSRGHGFRKCVREEFANKSAAVPLSSEEMKLSGSQRKIKWEIREPTFGHKYRVYWS